MPHSAELGMHEYEPPTESPSRFTQAVEVSRRVHRIMRDPAVRAGLEGVFRTLANAGIVAADFLPGGFGEIGSWTADAAKTVARIFGWKQLDLTPDVALAIALGSELAEAPTAGAAPSHAVEALMQLGYDIPRIREAIRILEELWRAEAASYVAHEEEIKGALAAFGVTPPETAGGQHG